jgi:hypothetical protein
MRTRHFALACLIGLACWMTGATALTAAPLDLAPNDTDAAEKIAAYCKDIVDDIVKASTEKQVVEARASLAGGYRTAISRGHAYTYTLESTKAITPLLTGGLKDADPLKQLKEVNVALFVSRLKDVSAQAGLDEMAGQDNPGVRLLAWKGYKQLQPVVLSQGFGPTKTMFDRIVKAAATEKDWPVLGRMIEALTLPLKPGSAVTAQAWQYAQQESQNALEGKWKAVCRAVRASSPDGIHVARLGIAAWRNLHLIDPDDANRTKVALQAIIDAVWCAGRAFDDAGAKGRVALDATLLLRDGETAMNEITKQDVGAIHKALQETGPAVGAAVREAVLDRAEALMKSHKTLLPKDSRFQDAPAKPAATP